MKTHLLADSSSTTYGAQAIEEALDRLFEAAPAPNSRETPAALLALRRRRAQQRLVDALLLRGEPEPPAPLLKELERLIRTWSTLGFPDGFSEVERFELRCAEAHALRHAQATQTLADREEAAYRDALVGRYGAIELRGLQVSHRVRQELALAYVPLDVDDPSAAVSELLGGLPIPFGARVPAEQALVRHPRLRILGRPGSGKSTLLAALATRLARRELKLGDETPLPFVVLARSLRQPKVDVQEIAAQAELDPAFVAARLPNAVLLVDGLDEAQDSLATQASLQALAQAHPGLRMVYSSRPAALQDSPAPEGFQTVHLSPLTAAQRDDFIDRWCLAAERSLMEDKAQARAQAEQAAKDLKDRVRSSPPIERLAENPLMCSVICVVHRFLGQRIPERRAALYEACTNVLLYEWDRAKFPPGAAVSQLDAQQKRTLLGGLALKMHKAKRAELEEPKVRRYFAQRLPKLGRPREDAGNILDEIRLRSGVLMERSPGVFGFSHLGFQEYLTARELVGRRQFGFLASQVGDDWWSEVTVLAAGLPNTDAGKLIRALLKQDEEGEVGAGTVLAAQCMEAAVEVPVRLRREVERRMQVLVPPTTLLKAAGLMSTGKPGRDLLRKHLSDSDPSVRLICLLTLSSGAHRIVPSTLDTFLTDSSVFNFQQDAWRMSTGPMHFSFLDGLPVHLIASSLLVSSLIVYEDPEYLSTLGESLFKHSPFILVTYLTRRLRSDPNTNFGKHAALCATLSSLEARVLEALVDVFGAETNDADKIHNILDRHVSLAEPDDAALAMEKLHQLKRDHALWSIVKQRSQSPTPGNTASHPE